MENIKLLYRECNKKKNILINILTVQQWERSNLSGELRRYKNIFDDVISTGHTQKYPEILWDVGLNYKTQLFARKLILCAMLSTFGDEKK